MKKLLFLSALLLALAGRAQAQTAPPTIAVVRIYEGMGRITAIITRGEGQSEKVEFDKGSSDKNLTLSSEGYYQLIQRLYKEGYVLQTAFNTPRSHETSYVTLFFTKSR